MASVVKMLSEKGVITPPPYVKDTHYEVIMGSNAYGVSNDLSDMDIYGFCIPPKAIVFPHLAGYVEGFGSKPTGFEQFQKHHIADPNGIEREYDMVIYSIVKYFDLCMGCNPNMIDSMFVPDRCVLHATEVGRLLRSNRKLFLSRKAHHTFKGYAYNQLHKVDVKTEGAKKLFEFESKNGKDVSTMSFTDIETYNQLLSKFEAIQSHRKHGVRETGYDAKFLYHVRRLLVESEQIMTVGDIDLEADREALKAIRRGEVKPQEVRDWFSAKEKHLDELYNSDKCHVPMRPDEEAIKTLLLNCLEIHFGSLSDIMVKSDSTYQNLVMQVKKLFQDSGVL